MLRSARKIKILCVVAGLPANGGGFSEVVPALSAALARNGAEVTIATRRDGSLSEAAEKAAEAGVRIVADLLKNGYDGGFSMEPHMAVVAHDASVTSEADIRFANYVEYGRRFEKILASCRANG